jgi:hypothetical protein
MLVLSLIALAMVALGASTGWAWQWHRDRPWVQYGHEQWRNNNQSSVLHDITTIRHEAQAEMLRAAAEWRRSR